MRYDEDGDRMPEDKPDRMPLHERIDYLEKSNAEIRERMGSLEHMIRNFRETVARELGL